MNRITLQATVFENRPQGTKTVGYRIYDSHGKAYSNTLQALPDDDLELLRIAMDYGDETTQDMIGFCLEYEVGLYIGDEWYEWDQIKHLFVGVNDQNPT